MEGLVRQVQHAQPARLPEYSKHLRTLAMRMLAKNPDDRPSAQDLIRAVPCYKKRALRFYQEQGYGKSAAVAQHALGRCPWCPHSTPPPWQNRRRAR